MSEKTLFHGNSPAIQSHLEISQTTIQRMASNSVSCKTWCVTLVSAILVIVADKGKPQLTLIAIIPAILFLVLDTYYLSLEKGFRESYNIFIKKLHHENIIASDLYVISPPKSMHKIYWKSIISFAIWPFYLTLLAMIFITELLII